MASAEPFPVERYFCLAVTVGQTQFKAYLDGERVCASSSVHIPRFNSSQLLIGAGGIGETRSSMRGVIDDMLIYRGVLRAGN